MSQTIQEKLKILQNGALKNVEKKYGENSYYLGEKKIQDVPIICSSGSLSLDAALGIGGFPEGRIIEIGGQESSGKSTLTLINIAEVQKNGKLCAYLDVEQSFDPVYASRLGVDVSTLTVVQPETTEETFDILFDLISSGVMSYIVVDSTNSMIPKKMLEGDPDTALMGKNALLFSQQLPKVVSLASTHKCTVVFLSQVRSKIGVVYGSPEVIGVGNAMKFAASIRIKTSKTEIQKDDEEGQTSIDVVMSIFKNKVAPPYKKAQFTLLTGHDGKYGIDTMKEVVDYAVKFDIVKKAGSWYSYNDEKLGQGDKNVKKYFEDNPSTYNMVKQQIIDRINKERIESRMIDTVNDSFNNKISESVEAPKKRRANREEVSEAIPVETIETTEE